MHTGISRAPDDDDDDFCFEQKDAQFYESKQKLFAWNQKINEEMIQKRNMNLEFYREVANRLHKDQVSLKASEDLTDVWFKIVVKTIAGVIESKP